MVSRQVPAARPCGLPFARVAFLNAIAIRDNKRMVRRNDWKFDADPRLQESDFLEGDTR